MARRPRIDYPGAWHHVMNRGAAHQTVFRTDADRRRFLALVGQVSRRYGLEVHAYALLGTHFHMLVRSPDKQLSVSMQFLMREYTQRSNRSWGRDGSIFRGRFASIVVDSDAYLNAVVTYIHRNPIGAGLASNDALELYRWSSYPAYIGLTTEPLWLCRTRPLEGFSTASATSPPVGLRHDGLIGCDVDIDDIDTAVRDAAGVTQERLRTSLKGGGNVERLVTVELAATLTGHTRQSLADRYGFASRQAISSAIARSKAHQTEDAVVRLRSEVLAALGLSLLDEQMRRERDGC